MGRAVHQDRRSRDRYRRDDLAPGSALARVRHPGGHRDVDCDEADQHRRPDPRRRLDRRRRDPRGGGRPGRRRRRDRYSGSSGDRLMTVDTLRLTQEFVAGPARIRFDVLGSQPVDTAIADKDFLDYRLADVRIETEPTLRHADIVWERDAEKSIAYDGRRMTFRGDWASGPIQKVVVTMLALRLEENGLHPFHASSVRYRDKTVL